MRTLVLILDLAGTFVFALAGATAAARRHLDIFGVLAVAFAAACSGGITRDVLIGAVPPAAIIDWRYLATSLVAGTIAFRWHATIERMAHPVRVFDAAGLALFAVAGAQKALAYDLNAVMAAVLGMLTASAAASCATCCSLKCPSCCVPICTRSLRLPARRSSCWAIGSPSHRRSRRLLVQVSASYYA